MADSPFDSLSGAFGNASPLQLGTGALALGGLGYMAAQGPGSLPPQFQQLEASVPDLQAMGKTAFGQGQSLISAGEQNLAMGSAGQLTPAQQAQLQLYSGGLNNQSRQMFYNMGRNPDADTAAITQQGLTDTQVLAMSQKMIDTTIQLGLGEISGGTSLTGQGLGFESAANQALIAAGTAQLKQDQQYSTNLMGAFGAIGKMFGFSGFGGGGSSAAGGISGSALDALPDASVDAITDLMVL